MAYNKIMFFFSDGKFGWSETYWGTAYNQTVDSALQMAIPLAKARSGMLATLGNTCGQLAGCTSFPRLDWVRVSNAGPPRSVRFYDPNGANIGVGLPPGYLANARNWQSLSMTTQAADNPYSAFLMSSNLSNGGISRRPISGVPDDFICDQNENPTNPFIQAWIKFAKVLTSGGFGANSYQGAATPGGNYVAPPLPPWIQITGMTQDAEGRPTLTLAQPIVFPDLSTCCNGFHVTISCYRQLNNTPVINGNYRALPLQASGAGFSSLTLFKSFKPLTSWCLGYIAPYYPTVYQFMTATLERPVKRNRGRPFGLPRGRRRLIR